MLAGREAAEHVERIGGAAAAERGGVDGLGAADLLAIDADGEQRVALEGVLTDPQPQGVGAAADRGQVNVAGRGWRGRREYFGG